ncbi:DUF7507 domain-containing protein [Myroides odoratimimus]|uniref:DUF7507 domain-containing protein n=1 Tax=Myroides odoratimimus TaxID=76832 RepID=UPI0031018F22
MNRKLLIKVLMLLVLFLGMGSSTYAQFLINENFRGKTTDVKNKIVTGGSPTKAYLTAAGTNGDSEGEGWIRLNNDGTNQKGFFFVDQSFPSDKGVFVDFEYKTWRSKKEGSSGYTDGDGIGVFLFDASVTEKNFALGGYGGSLGYAPMGSTKGLKGGYIGLGIDEFGNYSSTADGKHGKNGSDRQYKHRLALRGKTIENVASNKSNLLLYSETLSKAIHGDDLVGYTTVVKDRPSDEVFYRRVQIEINPIKKNNAITGSQIIVRWAVKKGGAFYEVMNQVYNEVPPANLKIGFAASTGGAINFHEVRDLFATTPGGVMIEKVADKSLVNVGDELTYTINLKGQNVDVLPFKFTDDFAAISEFFEVTSITHETYGNAGNKVTLPANAKNLKDIAVTLGRLGTISFSIKGKVKKAPNNAVLRNTATISKTSLPADIQKLVSDNQLTSSTSTQVIDPDFCGCPEGAISLQNSGTAQTLKAGKVYCVNGEVSIVGGLTVEQGAALYVQSGAKLKVKGTYTQQGGVVSICPKGGFELDGSAMVGFGGTGDSRIILKNNAYFTITGSFTQYEPINGKVSVELNDTSVVEICATFDQHAKTYPIVKYTGTGLHNAYFIVKAQASGGGTSVLTNSDNVNVIAMNTVTNLNIGSKNYCGPNATQANCKMWPNGLTDKVVGVKCNQAEGITDRTEPVGPDFCDYPGDKFISGYHSTIIKTATGFQIFGEQTMPRGGTQDHFLVPTDITFANGFNYEGSPLMATIGSQYYANNQNFLLTTKGLYVWGTQGSSTKYAVIHPDLVTSNAFQKIELPTGVLPKDVKYMTASNNVLAILLNNGQIKISGTKATLYGDGTSTINKEWHTVSTAGSTPLQNVEMMKMHATGGFAYTKDGKYYAWGTTVFNGASKVYNANYSYAVLVKAPFATKPVMIGITGIGEDDYVSYFALSEEGKVYSIGSNTRGQLGVGNTSEQVIWQTVKKEDKTELTDIKYLSAQDNSSYEAAAGAINKYGRVYFWGANGYNMLGQSGGDLNSAKEPQGLNDNRVVYVEVGGHTSMIVNDKNKYCYVGHKIYGSMGDGIAADSSVHTFDCENTPNVVDMCGVIEIIPEPGLVIEKTGTYSDANGDGKVNVGDVINYTFKVRNTGNTGLKNITIADEKIEVKGGPINLPQNAVDTETFSGTYVIQQEDIERGGVLNIATGNGEGEKGGKVTTTSVDPNPNKPKPTDPNYPVDPRYPEENDKYKNCVDCTVTILEQQPSIALVKVGIVDEDADTTEGNGVINYTFTIKNTGNVSLTLKDFKDSKIPNFTPVFTEGQGTGRLDVGNTWTATATYRITDTDVDAEKVENRAEVTGTAPKGKTTTAESKDDKGLDKPTITPVEGGGPLITNPHIYHKVQ